MNNEQKLEKLATDIIDQIKPKDVDNYSFAITILMVISIILTLIRVIQECDKTKIGQFSQDEKYSYFNSQIKEKTTKRSWFTKMMTKKAIRKQLSKENYKEYGVALMNAILNTGVNLTEDDVKTLVEASNV